MYKSRLIYLGIVTAAFIFSQALYEKIAFMTFVIALTLPLLSILLALLSYPLVSVKMKMSGVSVRRFESFAVFFTLKNRSPFILPALRLNCRLAAEDGFETQLIQFHLSASVGRGRDFSRACFFSNRGVYAIGVESVEYFDFLRLIKIKKPLKKAADIKVTPGVVELSPPVMSERRQQENSAYAGTAPLLSGGDVVGVREYVFGDNLKNAHWKLSAKSDDIIMKSFAEDVYEQAVVAADLSAYYDDRRKNMAMTDCVVETALSVMRAYMQNSVRFSLIFNVGKNMTRRFTVTSPAEFFEASSALADAAFVDGGNVTELFYGVEPDFISGCGVCVISSFGTDDALKSLKKLFIDYKSKLSVIRITDKVLPEKEGVLTYTREYIEEKIKGL